MQPATSCRIPCGILIPILLLLLIDRIAVHDRRIFSGCHLFFPPRVVFSCVVVLMAFSLLGSFSAQAEEAAVLETIVVQSEQEEQPLKDEQAGIPGATTIIDGEKQYQRAVNNLADTFRYAPSMWAQSFSGGDSVFFSSRGSNLDATNYDGNGVKMLQDGMPVTTADGNNHNRFIDPLLAKNIVIAPGANALTYGASTLGGAVDFISPTALDVAPTELFMSAGSDGQRTARATAGVVLDQFDALITVGDKDWDGYRHHSETDQQSVYINTGWKIFDDLENRLYVDYINSDQELPTALTKAEFKANPHQAGDSALIGNFAKNVETWRVADKTTWRIDERSSLELGVSHAQEQLYHPIVAPVMVDFDGPGPLPPVEVFSLLVDTKSKESSAMLRYKLQLDDHTLLAGVDYGYGDVEGGNYRNAYGKRNGLTEKVDNNAETLEAYVMDRWALGRWTLVYGAQGVSTQRDTKTTAVASGVERNPEADYHSINPRAGVIYALSNNSQLFANVSRLFEPPTNFELQDDVRGSNETLDPMHGSVVEFGSRGQMPLGDNNMGYWEATLYYAQIRDEILSRDDPAAPGNSLSTNIDKTVHAGIETLLGANFALEDGSSLEPLLSVTINHFRFDNDDVYNNNNLPAAPDYVMRGELIYRQANGFYMGPTFDWVGDRYADFSNQYKVDDYQLFGVRGGYEGKDWEVFAEMKNLADKDYVSAVNVLDYADSNAAVLYPGAPRSVSVGLRVKF